MLPAFGLAGSYSVGGFNSKAEALQYAINFTATDTENGTKANYEAAQELFDFICKNVKLPETKNESLDGFIERSTTLMESLQKKVEAKKLHPEDNPERVGELDGPPARPETELSQDRFEFDPNGPFCEG